MFKRNRLKLKKQTINQLIFNRTKSWFESRSSSRNYSI